MKTKVTSLPNNKDISTNSTPVEESPSPSTGRSWEERKRDSEAAGRALMDNAARKLKRLKEEGIPLYK
jgi:hypothetical protein